MHEGEIKFNFKMNFILCREHMHVFFLSGSKSVHVFYRLFIYVLPLEIQFSREQGCHLINCLTQPYFCACPKSGPGFPTSYMYVVVFFVISEFS
jgi:hypothetical protein